MVAKDSQVILRVPASIAGELHAYCQTTAVPGAATLQGSGVRVFFEFNGSSKEGRWRARRRRRAAPHAAAAGRVNDADCACVCACVRVSAGARCARRTERRRGNLVLQQEDFERRYPFSLVDLPTVIESYKTLDKTHMFKIADIAQMMVVHESEAAAQAFPSQSTSGITPPTHNITARFNPRLFPVDEDLRGRLAALTAGENGAEVKVELVSINDVPPELLEAEKEREKKWAEAIAAEHKRQIAERRAQMALRAGPPPRASAAAPTGVVEEDEDDGLLDDLDQALESSSDGDDAKFTQADSSEAAKKSAVAAAPPPALPVAPPTAAPAAAAMAEPAAPPIVPPPTAVAAPQSAVPSAAAMDVVGETSAPVAAPAETAAPPSADVDMDDALLAAAQAVAKEKDERAELEAEVAEARGNVERATNPVIKRRMQAKLGELEERLSKMG